MDTARLAEACTALALFPLPGVTLMPGSLLPLHVFEPRYRALVADCLAHDAPLCVPQLRADDVRDRLGRPAYHPYASVGVIAAHHKTEDGRYNILLQPLARVRLVEEPLSDQPYRMARAVVLHDLPVPGDALERAGEDVRALLLPLVARMGAPGEGLEKSVRALPAVRVCDAVAAFVLRDAEARQQFLAQDDPLLRARTVREATLTLLAEGAGAPTVAEA